jgi:hypothetical protein
MKSFLMLSTSFLVATALLVGCADPAADAKKDLDKTIEQLKRESEDADKKAYGAKDYLDSLVAQPGAISVSGILVARQGNQFVLDSRITTKQTAGKLANGEAAKISNDNAIKLSDTVADDAAKIETTKKYFNIGCTDLSEADTAGLEQVTNDSNKDEKSTVAVVAVDRAFICGDQKLTAAFLALTTQELILKDAHILNDKAVGNITIVAQSLKLTGDNSIMSKISESELNVHSSAPISIVVSQELKGQGTLTLSTSGTDAAALKKQEQEQKDR